MTEKIETTETMQLTEMDIKTLVRNALMVAGQEMGAEGDHWPVIKNTITDIMRDWEQLDVERTVHAEVKKHLYIQLQKMKDILETCTPQEQAKTSQSIKDLEELYGAFFEEVKEDIIYLDDDEEEEGLYLAEDEDLPVHIKRADAIINTLYEKEK